jgi:hypothetical protein
MTLDRGAGAGNGAACHEYARAGELPVVNFLQSRSIGMVNGHAEKHRRLIVQRSAHRKHREFRTLRFWAIVDSSGTVQSVVSPQ